MKFTNTVTINRPPAEVFAFLADLENLPQWNYAIRETQKISPGPPGIGSVYTQTRSLPTPSVETLAITDYELEKTLSIRGGFGLLSGRSTYRLDAIGAATQLTNCMELSATGATAIVALFATAQVKAAVAANLGVLKAIVEGHERRHAAIVSSSG
jgi:hypothetical protein